MVVEGNDDRRLAIELDGDKYHTPDRWADDLARQRVTGACRLEILVVLGI